MFFIAIICVVLEAICDLLGPTLMSRMINQGVETGSLAKVYFWGMLMLISTGCGACFAVTRNILSSHVSQHMGADLRADLFKKIISFAEESVDKVESGSLITRMTNDTAQVVQFVNGVMRIFLKAPILCIGSVVLASMLNFRLSLIIYGVTVLVTAFIYLSMRISYARFYQLQAAMDQLNSRIQEYLMGVRLVKAFGTTAYEADKFQATNLHLMQKGIAAQLPITVISPLLTVVVGIATVMVIYVGSRLFPVNLADLGDMTAFSIYMTQILTSLIMITNVFTVFVRTKASVSRIDEVFACESDFTGGRHQQKINGQICFEKVTFSYPGGSGIPAIEELSFSVSKGETLAVIGPTGSGKSTIVWLLLRFYEVSSGKICLDHADIKTLGVDDLRSYVAIVPQQAALFSGTVAQNLRWGNRTADMEKLRNAAQQAEAGFIEEMPDGFHSFLGSGGVNLSGGQKQRISIARGILKEAAILILDDTTSALDAITEARIRDNLRRNKNSQTMILITQRCNTAMFADKILVLEDGKKVGLGTHQQLIKNCEVYQEIYHSQIENVRKV